MNNLTINLPTKTIKYNDSQHSNKYTEQATESKVANNQEQIIIYKDLCSRVIKHPYGVINDNSNLTVHSIVTQAGPAALQSTNIQNNSFFVFQLYAVAKNSVTPGIRSPSMSEELKQLVLPYAINSYNKNNEMAIALAYFLSILSQTSNPSYKTITNLEQLKFAQDLIKILEKNSTNSTKLTEFMSTFDDYLKDYVTITVNILQEYIKIHIDKFKLDA
jgi:hypothetical protein